VPIHLIRPDGGPFVRQPLAQRFHQLVKATKGLNGRAFFFRKMSFGQFGQPVGGQVQRLQHLVYRHGFKPGKRTGKGPVEPVDVAFVFDHAHPGKVVEPLGIIDRDPSGHAFQKGQEFAQGYRHPLFPQGLEEREEHRRQPRSMRSR
jgi:hypothetical protein